MTSHKKDPLFCSYCMSSTSWLWFSSTLSSFWDTVLRQKEKRWWTPQQLWKPWLTRNAYFYSHFIDESKSHGEACCQGWRWGQEDHVYEQELRLLHLVFSCPFSSSVNVRVNLRFFFKKIVIKLSYQYKNVYIS